MRKLEKKKLQTVIERIAFEKMSVQTACEGLCAPSAFFRYMTEDKELEEQYTRARESRADARFESVDAVLANLHAGKIDANTARVMIDTIKWQCGKERPKRYSDRQQVDARFVDGDGNDRSMLGELDAMVQAAEAARAN